MVMKGIISENRGLMVQNAPAAHFEPSNSLIY
jgi:hypothetical protein